jgi:hypothetical protein
MVRPVRLHHVRAVGAAVMVRHRDHVGRLHDIGMCIRRIARPAQRKRAEQKQDQAETPPSQNQDRPLGARCDTLYEINEGFPHEKCHTPEPLHASASHVSFCPEWEGLIQRDKYRRSKAKTAEIAIAAISTIIGSCCSLKPVKAASTTASRARAVNRMIPDAQARVLGFSNPGRTEPV